MDNGEKGIEGGMKGKKEKGREWLGLGLNLEPWLKWGAGLPSVQRFCSSLEVLPAMMSEGTRDFGVVLGVKYWTEFSFKMRI